jgi:poly-gamma-glutamate synthesis protein (capsule biosynthesis protein)
MIDKINIGFVGDVAFTGIFKTKINEDFNIFDSSVKKILKDNDYNVINLEGPVYEGIFKKKGIEVSSPTKSIKYLLDNNLNVFNLANNHILDYSELGLTSTLEKSKFHGALTFGLNSTNQYGSKTIFIEKGNIKIALIGLLQSYKSLPENDKFIFTNKNLELVKNEIEYAKKKSDHVVLNYHGFEEYTFLPIPIKKQILRKYIDFGVDVIIGHHPHVVQGFQNISDKLIFYSLGNFVFDIPQHDTRKGTDSSVILSLCFTKNKISYDFKFINIDKVKGTLNLVKKNIASKYFVEINKKKYYKNWLYECNRLLFVDSQVFLKLNLNSNLNFIRKLKYYNRYLRLIKSYYKGKEAYRPILFSALRYKLLNILSKFNEKQ